jgi:hypothetical protein
VQTTTEQATASATLGDGAVEAGSEEDAFVASACGRWGDSGDDGERDAINKGDIFLNGSAQERAKSLR